MRTGLFRSVLAALIVLSCTMSMWPVSQTFDLVIINGHIMDGTGSPWYSGHVGIREGKIAAFGNLANAARTRAIDAGDKVVAPGFIARLEKQGMGINLASYVGATQATHCPRRRRQPIHSRTARTDVYLNGDAQAIWRRPQTTDLGVSVAWMISNF